MSHEGLPVARLKDLADLGESDRQNEYGECFEDGKGVPKDLGEAAKYYKMSADEGNAAAQYSYGVCLENGKGVLQNLTEAAEYYKMAADQGHDIGQYCFGLCLENGKGVSQNLSEAAKYYKMSMDQGFREAEQGYNRCIQSIGSISSGQEETPSNLIMNFSGYEKVKVLGEGRFGVVQLLEKKYEHKQLAVKYIEFGADFECDLLLREVAILASLNHPCIIRILGWSMPNSKCEAARIATEYASNGSIEDVLTRIKKGETPSFWTHENISCMIVGLVLGMKYIHSRGMIHRDLKPGNLLIDDKFRLRICDFGTAVFEECGTTVLAGTLAYMAPECLSNAVPTPKVDVFAFGLILYELLVGESVFPKGASITEIYELHQNGTRPEIPSWIPRSIAKLITSCWAPNPEMRPTFEKIYEKLKDIYFVFFTDVPPKVILDYEAEVLGQVALT
jgi:hypothetical protein